MTDRARWMWSSIPLDPSNLTPRSRLVGDHALIQWYNARGTKRRDLDPLLTNEDGADVEQQVLELNVLPPSDGSPATTLTWSGVTQPVDRSRRDLSPAQFLEIWVNDRVQDHSLTHAKLHIDLGRVSEDAFWERDAVPNNKLDTEDKNGDTKLDGGRGENGEDTGLDGLFDEQEVGYDPAANPDPNGDDYSYGLDQPADYSRINGTEGNGMWSSDGRPDSEDLNLNGILDLESDYFEAALDLSDTAFVVVDVARDYAGIPGVSPANGWRLLRVPIEGSDLQPVGSPAWNAVDHCRLWLSDILGPINLQVTRINVVGEFLAEGGPRAVLHQNHPNPFNPTTTIPYELLEAGSVRLAVYDIRGRRIRELVNSVKSAGPHFAFWSGRDGHERPVASGVYFYRLEAGGTSAARRMVLAK